MMKNLSLKSEHISNFKQQYYSVMLKKYN